MIHCIPILVVFVSQLDSAAQSLQVRGTALDSDASSCTMTVPTVASGCWLSDLVTWGCDGNGLLRKIPWGFRGGKKTHTVILHFFSIFYLRTRMFMKLNP